MDFDVSPAAMVRPPDAVAKSDPARAVPEAVAYLNVTAVADVFDIVTVNVIGVVPEFPSVTLVLAIVSSGRFLFGAAKAVVGTRPTIKAAATRSRARRAAFSIFFIFVPPSRSIRAFALYGVHRRKKSANRYAVDAPIST
jgi:hypothetical protein